MHTNEENTKQHKHKKAGEYTHEQKTSRYTKSKHLFKTALADRIMDPSKNRSGFTRRISR